jgi:mannose-6-phosphate isomerase-like protein (cupin superfamily)
MFVQRGRESPVNHRGNGQVSRLLLAPGQFGSRHLAVTWVEAQPGSEQPLHAHPESEQVYVIVRGSGHVTVAGERQLVDAGTLVLIPPGAEHAIYNPGPEPLVYVSAASPPFEPPTGEFAYRPAEHTEEP